MALFIKKRTEDIIFDKEFIIKEILEEAHERVPSWKIMCVDKLSTVENENLECDLLAIKSVTIQKEVSVTNNPFSNYRSIVPSTYQIVVPIYIVEEMNNRDSFPSYGWRSMCANSADILFRKLEQEE